MLFILAIKLGETVILEGDETVISFLPVVGGPPLGCPEAAAAGPPFGGPLGAPSVDTEGDPLAS